MAAEDTGTIHLKGRVTMRPNLPKHRLRPCAMNARWQLKSRHSSVATTRSTTSRRCQNTGVASVGRKSPHLANPVIRRPLGYCDPEGPFSSWEMNYGEVSAQQVRCSEGFEPWVTSIKMTGSRTSSFGSSSNRNPIHASSFWTKPTERMRPIFLGPLRADA